MPQSFAEAHDLAMANKQLFARGNTLLLTLAPTKDGRTPPWARRRRTDRALGLARVLPNSWPAAATHGDDDDDRERAMESGPRHTHDEREEREGENLRVR